MSRNEMEGEEQHESFLHFYLYKLNVAVSKRVSARVHVCVWHVVCYDPTDDVMRVVRQSKERM